MKPVAFWVADLLVSGRTAEKISTKHGLDVDEIRSWLVCVGGLRGSWHEHPERGWRLLVRLSVAGSEYMIVLYPADDPLGDVWNLGSAYRLSGGR